MDSDTPPDRGGDSQTDDDTPHSNWPWGDQGRPSDHNELVGGPQRQEPGSRDESGGVRLIPSRMWQEIRAVQSILERARRYRGQ